MRSLAIQREPETSDGFSSGRAGLAVGVPLSLMFSYDDAEFRAECLDKFFEGRHVRVVMAPRTDLVRRRQAFTASFLREAGVLQCFCEGVTLNGLWLGRRGGSTPAPSVTTRAQRVLTPLNGSLYHAAAVIAAVLWMGGTGS